MSMKTIGEKKAAVLAYCLEVCPDIGQVSFIREITATLIRTKFETMPESVWELLVGGKAIIVWERMDTIEAFRLYRLLGLEARYAVEAEKSLYETIIERNQKEARFQLVAEKARTAALVEALEEIGQSIDVCILGMIQQRDNPLHETSDFLRSEITRLSQDREKIEPISIAAHKKGGNEG